jgi:hypothetical protein
MDKNASSKNNTSAISKKPKGKSIDRIKSYLSNRRVKKPTRKNGLVSILRRFAIMVKMQNVQIPKKIHLLYQNSCEKYLIRILNRAGNS